MEALLLGHIKKCHSMPLRHFAACVLSNIAMLRNEPEATSIKLCPPAMARMKQLTKWPWFKQWGTVSGLAHSS